MSDKKDLIKGLEFKHATYARSLTDNDDALIVKEYIHYQDGRVVPNVRTIPNYNRSFYVTMEAHRNHKEKKEWEHEKKLKKYTCTQRQLPKAVGRALGMPIGNNDMRMLAQSPYLYGADIKTTSLIKVDYQRRWPDVQGPESSVACLDIETDVNDGSEDILIISITFKDKIITCVTEKYVGSYPNFEDVLREKFAKDLSKYVDERKINLEFFIFPTVIECIIKVFQKAHEWKPDFITGWNILYDLTHIEKAVKEANHEMRDIVSDPSVHPKFRHWKLTEGPTHMVTASGKPKLLLPAERWHVYEATASFYFIDSMCLYKRIRAQDGNLNGGYGLDNVLKKELKIGKLKYDMVPTEPQLPWHKIMQRDYKVEYTIYNIFDCISVELLDEWTGDIARACPALCGVSDYGMFKSNPKRICDDLNYYAYDERKLVIGTFADNVKSELDELVVSPEGWISCGPIDQ